MALKDFIRQKKRNEVLYLIFSRLTLFPLLMLILYFLTDYEYFLILFGFFAAFILLFTVPRWKRHLKSRFDFASKFIKILEAKTDVLSDALVKLSRHEFPKELYWVDFKIDTSSFRINPSFNSVNGSESTFKELNEIGRTIRELISVDPIIISELRRTGEDTRENLDLSIDLVQRWFSETWTMTVGQDIRLKATFSVTEKAECYNLKSRMWETV